MVKKRVSEIITTEEIKKWNKGYQAKNPTKIPTVLYLTQENSIEETKLSEIQPEININIIDEKKEVKIDDENGAVYL